HAGLKQNNPRARLQLLADDASGGDNNRALTLPEIYVHFDPQHLGHPAHGDGYVGLGSLLEKNNALRAVALARLSATVPDGSRIEACSGLARVGVARSSYPNAFSHPRVE